MSSSDRLVDEVIVTLCVLPVPLSIALTLTMPLASMSKVTSICGMPLGAGAMPSSWNLPSSLLSFAIGLSPWSTLMSTAVWLSAAVEKTCECEVGIVVLRSMSLVNTPPIVSMPSESGVTSKSSTSLTSPPSTPPWIAAPSATHSSGLMPLNGSLPVTSLTACTTAGMRVEPPTRMTLEMSFIVSFASASAFLSGTIVFATRSEVNASNFALVKSRSMFLGPSAVIVMKGRLMLVLVTPDSSIFAFSAASLMRCIVIASLSSMPSFSLKSLTM